MDWVQQVEEFHALQSVYGEAGAVEEDSEGLLAQAQQALESGPGALVHAPQLSGRVRLHDAAVPGDEPLALHFSLPRGYPCSASPVLRVECGARRDAHDALATAVAERAAAAGQAGHAGSSEHGPVGRRVIWFHHIRSPTKRKRIVEWADELDIGGFSVIGYPGVIICEGGEEDVAEYVKRIRALRWLAMALRAQEAAQADAPGSAGRCFTAPDARPLRELAADGGLSVLGAECRAVGLEHLFKAALKIGG
ncbi:hypothetical protein WJX81_001051 [Elliptochloris bilobata]|uniref:Small nuclear ribonucleoprotein Prp3 C-terminal domain-containing protein n=1 Tax=Elliptochloris bilobata TaxID=381761 RepID=A0AAW1RZG8_9CHLO